MLDLVKIGSVAPEKKLKNFKKWSEKFTKDKYSIVQLMKFICDDCNIYVYLVPYGEGLVRDRHQLGQLGYTCI